MKKQPKEIKQLTVFIGTIIEAAPKGENKIKGDIQKAVCYAILNKIKNLYPLED